MIQLKYQNIKTFLQKVMFHIGQRKFLRVKKVKNTAPRTYVTGNLKAKEIVATFYEKELRKKWKG